jgi:hypothetical protein
MDDPFIYEIKQQIDLLSENTPSFNLDDSKFTVGLTLEAILENQEALTFEEIDSLFTVKVKF